MNWGQKIGENAKIDRELLIMKLTILRIEDEIVNCQLDNGTIIDIAGDGSRKTYKRVIL